ncbi:MAG: nicotinate-nicotinamide nucleotide adenylyltransferase, partial [Actinomycetota bacterium]
MALTRIGLFGGTFDPPHVGHLVTAVNVRHALDLDLVFVMVANDPWQKTQSREVTTAEDRFAMVEAAVADVEALVAGRHEIDRGGPSFTADTLAQLSAEHPGARLFTIVGDDAASSLPTWARANEVAATSTLVVVAGSTGVSVESMTGSPSATVMGGTTDNKLARSLGPATPTTEIVASRMPSASSRTPSIPAMPKESASRRGVSLASVFTFAPTGIDTIVPPAPLRSSTN